ncbi:hypothetical protein [Streptomyces sp. NBC_00091]|uniref:hypothetical protein n=1 Tax=Streptomyces sp. NBC_00091 TaxID=2975648 RepID=UPI00224F5FF2|nr:hypothetical protein [Streptomyces sp. NBC_00091]MCX5377578.1 hypothetical protein [Streptomyces sp. NBC_00091]
MRNSTTKRRRPLALALALAALASVPALAGTAVAVDDLYAPHARAAAKVQGSDGDLLASKNVASSWQVDTGKYCVKITDPDIDLTDAVVLATPNSGSGNRTAEVRTTPTSTCGDNITVFTHHATAGYVNTSFTIAVL